MMSGVNFRTSVLPSVLRSIEHLDLPTFIYKPIDHIAYARCSNGTIYKCMLGRCRVHGFRFQTLKKQEFISHLERCHIGTQWSGCCTTCEKIVASKGTIFNEFIHMRKDHIKKEEKVQIESLPSEGIFDVDEAESLIDNLLRELHVEKTQDEAEAPVLPPTPASPEQITMGMTLQGTALADDPMKAITEQPTSSQSIQIQKPSPVMKPARSTAVSDVAPSLSPDPSPVNNQMDVSESLPVITPLRRKRLELRIEKVFSLQDEDASPFAYDIFAE